jgi:uncharacterized membrane protein YeiH
MNLDIFHSPFLALDYVGVAVFAASGALAAARHRHDVLTFIVFAFTTGVGGGTLRDLLIGAPVFWIHASGYLIVSLVAALIIWIVGKRPWRFTALVWLDAIGLVIYAVIGAGKALAYGVSPMIAIVMGVMTATFGGIVRDVLAGAPSVLLRREIYMTAALVSALVFVVSSELGVPKLYAGIGAFACGFVLRGCAIFYGWALPGFDPQTPDEPPQP